MKEQYKNVQEKLLLVAQGVFFGLLVSLGPVALIHHRQLNSFFQHLDWSMTVFFALCIAQGIIACFYKKPSSANSFKLVLVLSYLTCYTACCALCQKWALTLLFAQPNNQINSSSSDFPYPIIILSWFLICLGAGIQVAIILKNTHHRRTPRQSKQKSAQEHSVPEHNIKAAKEAIRLSWLLCLTGVSLNFDVWLPLIAIPGIWVAINWLD
jgi:hypothetical protein